MQKKAEKKFMESIGRRQRKQLIYNNVDITNIIDTHIYHVKKLLNIYFPLLVFSIGSSYIEIDSHYDVTNNQSIIRSNIYPMLLLHPPVIFENVNDTDNIQFMMNHIAYNLLHTLEENKIFIKSNGFKRLYYNLPVLVHLNGHVYFNHAIYLTH